MDYRTIIRCTDYFDRSFDCSFSKKACLCEYTTKLFKVCYDEKFMREEHKECRRPFKKMRANQTAEIKEACAGIN